jgi:FHA domain
MIALWLRGDGRFEMVDIDTSVLPRGDPIVAACILRGSARIPMPNGHTIVFDDPCWVEESPRLPLVRFDPALSEAEPSLDEARASSLVPVASQGAAIELGSGLSSQDKLVVCGKLPRGLRQDLPEWFEIKKRKLVIGSDPRCDIVIDHDRVSRRHVELSWVEPGHYFARDLGSKRGTFINRKRVPTGAIVDGDYIDLGGAVSFQFTRGLESPARQATTPPRGISALFRGLVIGKDPK